MQTWNRIKAGILWIALAAHNVAIFVLANAVLWRGGIYSPHTWTNARKLAAAAKKRTSLGTPVVGSYSESPLQSPANISR